MKIQSLDALEAEMKAVARGERPARADAAALGFESLEALAQFFNLETRRLLAAIRDRQPESVEDLAAITGRQPADLHQKLEKLRAAGLIEIETDGHRQRPIARAARIRVEIDPYSETDLLELV